MTYKNLSEIFSVEYNRPDCPSDLFVDVEDFGTVRVIYTPSRELQVEIWPNGPADDPADVARVTAKDLGY